MQREEWRHTWETEEDRLLHIHEVVAEGLTLIQIARQEGITEEYVTYPWRLTHPQQAGRSYRYRHEGRVQASPSSERTPRTAGLAATRSRKASSRGQLVMSMFSRFAQLKMTKA